MPKFPGALDSAQGNTTVCYHKSLRCRWLLLVLTPIGVMA